MTVAAKSDASAHPTAAGATDGPRVARQQIEAPAIYVPPTPASGAPSVRTGGATRGGHL